MCCSSSQQAIVNHTCCFKRWYFVIIIFWLVWERNENNDEYYRVREENWNKMLFLLRFLRCFRKLVSFMEWGCIFLVLFVFFFFVKVINVRFFFIKKHILRKNHLTLVSYEPRLRNVFLYEPLLSFILKG